MMDLTNPGFKAAWLAMLMDDPDPINPGSEDSPMHMLERSLVAYDKFKMYHANSFSAKDVRGYVLEHEAGAHVVI